MQNANKYKYIKVIQQYYATGYGWEDVSEYETDSKGRSKDKLVFVNDLKNYRLLGYATRVIKRREINNANA